VKVDRTTSQCGLRWVCRWPEKCPSKAFFGGAMRNRSVDGASMERSPKQTMRSTQQPVGPRADAYRIVARSWPPAHVLKAPTRGLHGVLSPESARRPCTSCGWQLVGCGSSSPLRGLPRPSIFAASFPLAPLLFPLLSRFYHLFCPRPPPSSSSLPRSRNAAAALPFSPAP